MFFFSKLFGNKQDDKPVITANLPVQRAELKGITQMKLSEILQTEYRDTLNVQIQHRREAAADPRYTGGSRDDELVDRIKVQYSFDLEYVVFEEKLLRDMIGNTDLNENLNELFYVSLTEFGSVSVGVIEGDAEHYAKSVLDQFNEACKDWGIRGKNLAVKSIEPVEECREFYEAYKKVWG